MASWFDRHCRLGTHRGDATAATPAAIWWLDPSTVHAIAFALIAAIYIGLGDPVTSPSWPCMLTIGGLP